MSTQIAAVMIHVSDPIAGLDWYEKAFSGAFRRHFPDSEFEYLDYGGAMLEVVAADAKVTSGAAGTVVYWQVADFAAALAHFEALGAALYRGPMEIEAGASACVRCATPGATASACVGGKIASPEAHP